MFKLFKKEKPKIEDEFLTIEDCQKVSQEYIDKGLYDEATLRVIRIMESDIKEFRSKGFFKATWYNEPIGSNADYDRIKKHFENRGFVIKEWNPWLSQMKRILFTATISWDPKDIKYYEDYKKNISKMEKSFERCVEIDRSIADLARKKILIKSKIEKEVNDKDGQEHRLDEVLK